MYYVVDREVRTCDKFESYIEAVYWCNRVGGCAEVLSDSEVSPAQLDWPGYELALVPEIAITSETPVLMEYQYV